MPLELRVSCGFNEAGQSEINFLRFAVCGNVAVTDC